MLQQHVLEHDALGNEVLEDLRQLPVLLLQGVVLGAQLLDGDALPAAALVRRDPVLLPDARPAGFLLLRRLGPARPFGDASIRDG